MISTELQNKYFRWLYKLVCGYDEYNGLSYKKLLMFLFNTEFTYFVGLDCNRAQDGIDFRYRFGYKFDIDRDIIAKHLDTRNCSVLEMMIAMAYKVEEQIMDDEDYGNRTGQWFWNMIVNLGLGKMSDMYFDESYVSFVIMRFLNREYEPDGRGGLFTIENSDYDMRKIEIWVQFMRYLDTIIDY